MQIIIVSHYKRSDWVRKLLDVFPGAFVVVDFLDRGALWAHTEAIKLAAMLNERCIIMEDDAIPVEGFADLAARWYHWYPDELISFYLGTGRPKAWQDWITGAFNKGAMVSDSDGWVRLPALIHGVCYTFPPDQAQAIGDGLKRLNGSVKEADTAVGKAWGKPVLYPVESLVEHRDQGSVERHPDGQPRTEPRVARFLAGPLAYPR
jgi:hypothetical protein